MKRSSSFPGDLAEPVAAMLEVHRRRARSWLRGCAVIGVILLLVGSTVMLSTGLPAWLAAVSLAVGVFLLLSVIGGAADARIVRLLPYFREQVPGPFTLLRGKALLRASGLLDRVASDRDVTPLTEFLCEDPLRGGTPVWHEAARAVETLDALLEALPAHREGLPDYEELLKDCHEWRERLAKAAERDVPFYVMMRFGDSISGHEMSVRGGEF